MKREGFYRLEQPRFGQYATAYYEADEHTACGEFPKCPKCGGAIGMRRWLPPRRVHLKQARDIGDLIFGAGGGDMLVSEKFKETFERSGLTGIKEFNPVEVVSIIPKNESRRSLILFEAVIGIRQSKVLFEKMGVTWQRKPTRYCCDLCGPGGGGRNGVYESYARIVVDASSILDSDLFYAINLPGVILLSSSTREFFLEHSFKNATLTPSSKASFNYVV